MGVIAAHFGQELKAQELKWDPQSMVGWRSMMRLVQVCKTSQYVQEQHRHISKAGILLLLVITNKPERLWKHLFFRLDALC